MIAHQLLDIEQSKSGHATIPTKSGFIIPGNHLFFSMDSLKNPYCPGREIKMDGHLTMYLSLNVGESEYHNVC